MTAGYIAGEFRRFGLKPGGDSGTYLQKYPLISRRLNADASSIVFEGPNGVRFSLPFTTAAASVGRGAAPPGPIKSSITLLSNVVDPAQLLAPEITNHFVIWVVDLAHRPANYRAVIAGLTEAGAGAIGIIANDDSAFQQLLQAQARARTAPDLPPAQTTTPPTVYLSERAIVAAVPGAADQFNQLRASPAPIIAPMPDWESSLTLRDTVLARTSAPNVVGVLRGSDPKLRDEYVFITGHMDHIGITPGAADSINNGADDDASGTVGVVELAEAFAKGPAPKRSMVFMTVSGEEKGLLGSAWYADHPTVPVANIVADLNMDMIGRNWKDTIVAIGKEHSDLGATLNRVNAAHPELRMTAIDDIWPDERFYFRSDHYNFARKGVPILFFFNGVHADYHQPSDSPDKIDAEKEARIVRLIYYVARDVANAPARPRWKPESYKLVVQGGGR